MNDSPDFTAGTAIPQTYVVDRKGRVLAVKRGERD